MHNFKISDAKYIADFKQICDNIKKNLKSKNNWNNKLYLIPR